MQNLVELLITWILRFFDMIYIIYKDNGMGLHGLILTLIFKNTHIVVFLVAIFPKFLVLNFSLSSRDLNPLNTTRS